MKLKYDIVIEDVVGEKIAVIVGEYTGKNRFIKLNNSGVYIMNLLKNDVTIDDILASIQKDFEIEDIPSLRINIESFIEQLKIADILE